MSIRKSKAEVEQRRQAVLRHVSKGGEVRIDDLAARLGVSLMTMHRDLDDLHERKLLHKRRAVAMALSTVDIESSLQFRENMHREAKTAIGDELRNHVSPGSTVLLDCGSTLFPLARLLGQSEHNHVITNSLRVAYLLADSTAQVTLLGDRFYPEFESCAGLEVLRQLDRFHIDVAFLTATCVHEGRLSHPVREYADNKAAFVSAADRAVLAVDNSKFGRSATYAYGDLSGYDTLITDDAAPPGETALAQALGVQVHAVAQTWEDG
ncbi:MULTISPECIES: DeoR/GlpR family DNA-binding transcription regulator [Saccharopolyspora]|uniref:DeoR/GlpR family DNA-binding transcription regulator n=1 Tax=Saccharopolyspora gregorii TaxID=33914 RepID=A0ABP6RST1_9PSEU|nr:MULTISPECIES: DeoR/GlpR family DNA-binding transcription regulator [Saccharopolyspora]MCA1188822.1 DeoR/GlpR family DNA-binding transcription regulator [Saccharopolyspora sp. 6T]MCA1193954.1 DeoR/GlpR family DNA-binding transcription regulator [Saccharopolyspora sp. 6V]MCA1229760.1 DeoR/GlpR family DNA-binding transcription regulator [Saccharopolyspora sp. 6M]MCA1279315.1 DeoR/GlpR family DNA-binding transcription regulator [Saccharopolyspora sp. 7B]